MPARFDSFILLAEMRTGSNFLEDTLNQLPGLRCWGEAFNPHFTGHARKTELAGITLQQREADPTCLLDAMCARTEGLAGFRFFHDHDPRILMRCMDDVRCAKVMLSRNPLDSFVSLEIARQTGQWRLGDMQQAKTALIDFDADRFARHLSAVQGFQQQTRRRLQTTGQTAFFIDYDDIGDLDILNGLAGFLGIDGRLGQLSGKTKVQNPAGLREKVVNYDEMEQALGAFDTFDMARTPNFEPRRGPNVPGYIRAATSPLLFMPVKGGLEGVVNTWLAALDGAAPLAGEMTQKDLRKWKRRHPAHRSFSAIRHPVARIHDSFCRYILSMEPTAYGEIRETLRANYGVPLPVGAVGKDWDAPQHHAAFMAFLRFVKGNLGNQTSIRVDPAWASQSAVLQGMAQLAVPDMVLREDRLAEGLSYLADSIGARSPDVPCLPDVAPVALGDIYDATVESVVRDIYQRDYMMFGFRAWR